MSACRKCYDNVDIDISKTPQQAQKKYLQKCVRLTERSALTHKHGCVIVDNKTGDIISQGFNCNMNNNMKVNSLHAEIAAIRNAKKNLLISNNCDMYIVRIGKVNGNFRYSKPCANCRFIIQTQTKIKHVYYSINSDV